MLNDLLFELGTEELPSGAVWPLADALASHLTALLATAKIQHGAVYRFATPRRLAVVIHDVQVLQDSQTVFRRGPAHASALDAEGRPLPPLLGFAKSCGVTVNELTLSRSDKGEWWVYEAVLAGAKTKDLLPAMMNEALAMLPIAKPMRWGNGDEQFARPVHWSVFLLGDELVETSVLGVATGRQSYGHRFHHPQAIEILNPRTYESQLRDAFVVADFTLRRQLIVNQVQQLAASSDFQAVMPESLLDEVTSIVEWPEALLANFEHEFLDVPSEALIAAMQSHQKCFALRDKNGHLLPHFITVANIESKDPLQVVKGNEKVMRARLSDAAFFYHQDKKQKLSEYYPATSKVVFQVRLGSLQDKMRRLQVLMDYLTSPLQLNRSQALRVAELSKCDLMTGMVGEFPELQGLMGCYYARHDGEDDAVAEALHEQYLPRFSADVLPQTSLGLALSLADRLDTVVGIFAMGQKPSGVKDPFKLRRHALAIVRLLTASPAALNLSTLIDATLHVYGEDLQPVDVQILGELKPFILDRLQSFYQAQGVSSAVVLAVRARQDDWFFDIDNRIKALLTFVSLPEAASLAAACKRVNNLLQHALLPMEQQAINLKLLEADSEKELFEQIQKIEQIVSPLYSAGEYGRILSQLASLHDPVNAFFENVMVMVDDQAIKANRLCLLGRLQQLLQGVADISLL